ncbi:MAG: SAM-dependent methyltransferase [Chlamydiales bacterium]|jgi:SAM-dependent methyltransferase
MPTSPLRDALAQLGKGTPYKLAFETLLVDVDEQRSEELMLLHNESRGAWVPLVTSTSGRALFLGHPLSGTVPPLADAGFDVTVVSVDLDWLRFGQARNEDRVPGNTRAVVASSRGRLPFVDRAFELVVVEDNPEPLNDGWDQALGELARVCRNEFVLIADNRLAYKRSKGRRGEYHKPTPIGFLRSALSSSSRAHTLHGYRRLLSREFADLHPLALYPDARDFSHVVGLAHDRPRLTIGPRERGNRVKLAGQRLGLFPWLTPSFAIIASRKPRQPRIERTLAELAERIGEPCPQLELLIGTRSNSAVMHTEVPGADPDLEAGRWTLHIALNPKKRWMMRHHFDFLRWIGERFPWLPVPEPLFIGEIGGSWITCERRLGGLSAPHLTGNLAATRRTFTDVVNLFAKLVVEPQAQIDEELYEETIGRRFRIVRGHARVPATVARLERMEAEVRERVLGKRIPLVLYHADIRSKHIQVEPDGSVLGFLDWGTSERAFLPYVDVMHMVTHQRKHEGGGAVGEPWRVLRDRVELADHEREALESYVDQTGLDDDVRSALELMLPVLVAGMAELHWDYSRPLWVHRQFGL